MYYSASTGGFYTPEIHGDNMPGDVVGITAKQHAELMAAQGVGKAIRANAQGYPMAVTPTPGPLDVPTSVTMRQARLALLGAGKYAAVQDAIAGASDAVRIDWEFAATVDRGSETTKLLATALGLDSIELNRLFTAAALL